MLHTFVISNIVLMNTAIRVAFMFMFISYRESDIFQHKPYLFMLFLSVILSMLKRVTGELGLEINVLVVYPVAVSH